MKHLKQSLVLILMFGLALMIGTNLFAGGGNGDTTTAEEKNDDLMADG